jgi:hypothetical protein
MISGQSGERAMFSTANNRVLFLDPAIAGKITELGINVREEFSITRKSTGKRGDRDEWLVERPNAPKIGERPDGTFAVPKLPPARSSSAACGQPVPALVDEANALVDAYAAVLNRALATYEGRIKPDEVRSILLSAYIQRKSFAA